MSLFDEGKAEIKPKSVCSVCAFIAAQPDEDADHNAEAWRAYIDSDESPAIVFRVMKRYGYAPVSDAPVRNHRGGHGTHAGRPR